MEELDSRYFRSYPKKTTQAIALSIVFVTILIIIFIVVVLFLSNKARTSTTVTCTTPANPPANISFTKVSATQFNVSWTAAINADSYKVYVGTTNGFTRDQAILVKAVGIPPAAITNLARNTTYYVFVTSINSCGESTNSEQASFFFTFP